MPRTIDHLVDVHTIAAARRASGRPIWDGEIRLNGALRNPDMTFEQRRDTVVAAVERSSWYRKADEHGELHEIVDNLRDAEDPDHFDGWWDQLYDLADYDRIFIRRD